MKLILFSIIFITLTNGLQAIDKPVSPSRQIDELVEKGLKAKGLEFNEPISDEVFVRRIHLDIIGRIPTKTETEAFLSSTEKNKRNLLINDLLNSDGYVSNFYHLWADMLRARTDINGTNQGAATGRAYEQWIKNALRENKPYDVMVRELLTASGHSWENGAVGYYIRDYGMPLDNTAMTAQVFLGTQIVCAQCHNHPFDKWTQMDYYHIAAFTYGMTSTNNLPQGVSEVQTAMKRLPEKLDSQTQKDLRRAFSEILKPVRFNNVIVTDKLPQLPHDYQYSDAKPKSTVTPASIMGPSAVLSPSQPAVESFANWVTSRENPRFTLVMSNRLWKKAFGQGLIEPIDDLKDHTAASNPELMSYLEGLFKQKNYDMKAYLAAIFKSKTYQRAVSLEEVPIGTPYDFPGPVLRRMSAEQVWDSVVAMVRENPDLPDEESILAAREQILRRQLIGESLYKQDGKQFVLNGLEVLKVQKDLSEKIDAAVTKLTEARETNDLQKISEASTEVKHARRALADEIERRVYLKGLKDGIEVAANTTKSNSAESEAFFNDLITTIKEKGNGDAMAGMEEIVDDEGGIVAKLVKAMLADEHAALHEKQVAQSKSEMTAWQVEKKNSKQAFNNFKTASARLVRASELPSPAPLGHFLREFGQSDRELIDNSNDHASVTQALTLLNGTVPAAVANPYSVFSRNMKEAANFKERLDNVYLTMFSRPATGEETAIFNEAWKANPEGATISAIAWTLLNTRQFIFIN